MISKGQYVKVYIDEMARSSTNFVTAAEFDPGRLADPDPASERICGSGPGL